MKKVLHISHHIGCFKDQTYILKNLGFEVLNFKFYDNLFHINKQTADNFWNTYKDTINKYDYILISDTSPISRCIMQNMSEFKSKLIIWICNRFDFCMGQEPVYYSLFNLLKDHKQVRVVASTFWEKIWCLKNGIDILKSPVINPLGKFSNDLNGYIPNSEVYNDWYKNNSNIKDADVFVPFYHNDNKFINLKNILENKNISVCNSTFSSTDQLKKYKAVVTLPDTFCKWFSFESIHEHIPVILPSKKMLLKFCQQPNYLFNMTGYGGAENMTEDLIDICEWYNPLFNRCRYYFDSIDEIPSIVYSINMKNAEFNECSSIHEKNILEKWKKLYESF